MKRDRPQQSFRAQLSSSSIAWVKHLLPLSSERWFYREKALLRITLPIILSGMLFLGLRALVFAEAHPEKPAKQETISVEVLNDTDPEATSTENTPVIIPETSEAKATSSVMSPHSEASDMDKLFAGQPHHSLMSTGYLIRIVLVLLGVLGVFYLFARFFLAKWMGPQAIGSVEAAIPEKNRSAFQNFLAPIRLKASTADLTAKVVSRTRLGPSREILVVQIAERFFALGSTQHQLNLLTEILIPPALSEEKAGADPVTPSETYQKYLEPQKPLPVEEDVIVLSDYEDQYEPPH